MAAMSDRLKEVRAFDESRVGVKGLSDSGITTIPSFFIHPKETLSSLKPSSSSSAAAAAIPLVDLDGFDSGDPLRRRDIVERVREAAATWGFFQVVNHGVEPEILDETVAAVKAFHDLPPAAKGKHSGGEETHGVRYAVNNDLYRAKAASWHDYLQVFMSPEASPVEDIPEICRKEAFTWDARATEVGETVLELLSEGLGLEPWKLKDLTFSGSRVFVGTCYPYCPQPDLTVGIKSHTDPGTFTVLLTNRPGLQVKHGDEWVDVRPHPGALIINIGDFLQIVSNGEYRSVEHRVLANASKEAKISVVMFFNVSKWKGGSPGYFGPLPELLSPTNPPIYRDFTEVEFNQNFYSKALDSKSLIDKIKL